MGMYGEWQGFRVSVRNSDGEPVHYVAIARNQDEAKQAVWRSRKREDEVEFITDANATALARSLRVPNGEAFEVRR